ncbi:MAG: AtpZ/AtpI family protein [Bacillota bacterium]|nr:AtpZ/AtpI family protein [Bacillota bacterium]
MACISFGLTLGLSICIVGFILGGWLDQRLDSAPWCRVAGALLAIAASFYRLYRDLLAAERQDEENDA